MGVASLVAMMFNVLVVVLGGGYVVLAVFIVVIVVLMIFLIGYIEMVWWVTVVGGFYMFILCGFG